MNVKTIEYSKIKEKIYLYEHKSGVKVFYIPKKGYTKKFATFSTHFGSIDNKFKLGNDIITIPDGVAHFLEHKLFEQIDGNVMDKFSKIGADPNAYTSFSKTAYIFSCVDNFYESFKLLLNYVQNPYITEESVEREKGIIGQEIQMYNDDPGWRVFFNLLSAMYIKNPIRIDIAGTIESIAKINKDILYKCYEAFYNPSNMIIFVIGDLDKEKIFSIVDSEVKQKESKLLDRIYEIEPEAVSKEILIENMDVSLPLFHMGIKENKFPKIGIKSAIYEVGMQILMQMIMGKSSKLYEEMYNNGLINSSFSYSYTSEETFSHSIIGGESKDPEGVRDYVINHIKKLKKDGLSRDDFSRIRKSHYGRMIKYLNSIESMAHLFISVYYRDIYMLDYYSLYDKITYDLVNEIFDEHFINGNMVLSIIKPH